MLHVHKYVTFETVTSMRAYSQFRNVWIYEYNAVNLKTQ